MRIDDLSKTDFDRAKIKLTGHFDRRPTGRYFEPWLWRAFALAVTAATAINRFTSDLTFAGSFFTGCRIAAVARV